MSTITTEWYEPRTTAAPWAVIMSRVTGTLEGKP